MSDYVCFGLGPVKRSDLVCQSSSLNYFEYFRSREYSEFTLGLARDYTEMLGFCEKDFMTLFFASSGTGVMDAVASSLIDEKSRCLVISGGTFGKRFEEILSVYRVDYDVLNLRRGFSLALDHFEAFRGNRYDFVIYNLHETSTGVLYDQKLVRTFADEVGAFVIGDAISAVLTDRIYPDCVDFLITSSHKALALSPGLSMLTYSKRALSLISLPVPKSFYFNLVSYIENGIRGQSPWTPSVGIMFELRKRVDEIVLNGGIESFVQRSNDLAKYFREGVRELPFVYSVDPLKAACANFLTCLTSLSDEVDMYQMYEFLRKKYRIDTVPSGGEFKKTILRVGHAGVQTIQDYDLLIFGMFDYCKRSGK